MREVRRAYPHEAPLLTALALRSKAYWGYSADFMRRCTADLSFDAAKTAQSYVLVEGQTLCALSTLARDPQDATRADVVNLFVDPPYIGQGCGRSLWEHARAWAQSQGCTRLYIEADPNAVPFYTRMGAQSVGTVLSSCIEGRTLPLMCYVFDED